MPSDGITVFGLQDRLAWETATTNALPGQSWGHAAGLAAGGYAPKLAVVDAGGARMLLPFHERSFAGVTDIASLPSLSGVLIQPDHAAPLLAWAGFARQQGWVAGYLQLSPLNDGLIVSPPDRIRAHNSLYVFDLAHWNIARSVGISTRRSLRKGERAGARLVTDEARIASAFATLHSATRARNGEPPAFGSKSLAAWFAAEGVLAFGAEVDGQIVAAQIGRGAGDWADLHLAGATAEGRPLQGWLIWQAAEWLRARGFRHLNIGGYGVAGDGLHQMKARLGAVEHPLRAVLQVYDREVMARLCAETGTGPATDYFPPYRAPQRS